MTETTQTGLCFIIFLDLWLGDFYKTFDQQLYTLQGANGSLNIIF